MTTEPSPQPDESDDLSLHRLSPLVHKSLIKERIETKIEEFKETLEDIPDEFFEPNGTRARGQVRDLGIIHGLELALQILEES